MLTYQVLDSNKEVMQYFTLLRDAKAYLMKHGGYEIVCLSGPYYAEGFHKYRLRYNGTKFKHV